MVRYQNHRALDLAQRGFSANAIKSKDADRRTEEFERVRHWMIANEGADHAVISSEFFAPLSPVRMHKVLAEQLPDEVDGIRVISYVRPHASRFLAAFVQRIKTGHYLGNLETFLERIGQDDTLNYAIRLAK